MENHNDPSKYNLHSQEQRNHLPHDKGKVVLSKIVFHSPSPTPFRNDQLIGIQHIISATPIPEIPREVTSAMNAASVLKFSKAVGDSPLTFVESEETKKSGASSMFESFSGQMSPPHSFPSFQVLVKTVSESYLDKKMKQKEVVKQYLTYIDCALKYRNTVSYLKANERCEKEKALFDKKLASRNII